MDHCLLDKLSHPSQVLKFFQIPNGETVCLVGNTIDTDLLDSSFDIQIGPGPAIAKEKR